MTQTTAMNNNMRDLTKAGMTNSQIIRDAKKKGFRHTGRCECPACVGEMEVAMQTVGYTGTTPPWAIAKMGLVFKDKHDNEAIACECGYRGRIPKENKGIKFGPAKGYCAGEGCNKKLPKGRTKYCFECWPKGAKGPVNRAPKQEPTTKEPASRNFTM